MAYYYVKSGGTAAALAFDGWLLVCIIIAICGVYTFWPEGK